MLIICLLCGKALAVLFDSFEGISESFGLKMSSSDGLPKIKPLSNSNYPEWSGEMRAWLMRNGLWKLVSGKLPMPRDADELAKWETKAEKAAGEIYRLVENNQRVHIRERG